jgi:two-component system, LytTR family, response regulator
MKIQYITLDDNHAHLDQLNETLQHVPQTECLASFNNPEDAFNYLQTNNVDVMFLDIEMSGMNGIELAKKIVDPPLFVFISSHSEFGADTYELDALDYILKPITLERLLKSFKRMYKFLESKANASNELKFDVINPQHFFIRENQQFIRIDYNDVMYVESLNSFVCIYLSSGKKHLVLVGLKNLEEQLDAQYFLRISRSLLVNKSKITAFSHSHIILDKINLNIGPTYSQKIQDALGAFTITRFIE